LGPFAHAQFVLRLLCVSSLGQEKEASQSKKSKDDGWVQLFNGKDLTGWKTGQSDS
jgi:hypothetical protein